jgi:hypothetical protein
MHLGTEEVVSMRRGGGIGLAAIGLSVVGMVAGVLGARAQGTGSSDISVNEENFATVLARMSAAKAAVMKRQMDLRGQR